MKISLVALAIAAMGAVATAQQGGCPSPRVRKEIRQLTPKERDNYRRAIYIAHRSNKFDIFAELHVNNTEPAHGVPMFFPWHRRLLWEYEKILSDAVEGVTLPFWDWSMDAIKPENSPVFRNDYLGGNGRQSDNVVATGPFRFWKLTYPHDQPPHFLKRIFTPGPNNITPFWSTEALISFIKAKDNYADLHDTIEDGPHATVHIGIGGDMVEMYSPNDPFFFLHHAMVDRIWALWQNDRSSNFYQYNGVDKFNNNRKVQASDILPTLPSKAQLPVSDFFDTKSAGLCYVYEDNPTWTQAVKALDQRNKSKNNLSRRAPAGNFVSSVIDFLFGSRGDDKKQPPADPVKFEESRKAAAQQAAKDLGYEGLDISKIPKEETKLKEPMKNPDSWNKMNNLDPKKVEEIHAAGNKIIEDLNNDPNYIPVAALYNAAVSQGVVDKPGPAPTEVPPTPETKPTENPQPSIPPSQSPSPAATPAPKPTPAKTGGNVATFTNTVTKDGVPSPVVVVVHY